MKHFLPLILSMLFFGTSYAQLTGISVEEYQDHSTTGIAELEGMITYRVFVDCTTSLDEVSAVYGDATSPLVLDFNRGVLSGHLR